MTTSTTRKFYRSKSDRVFGGVCGGVARYFKLDPLLTRIGWVVATLISFGVGIIAYILVWVLSEEQ